MENFIMYVADQWRSDSLGLNGNEATYTPTLDALAADGVNYSNAFCQNPVCVPSRCSFLSGLYPHTLGHRTMHHMMREHEQNILKTMKNSGYEVLWCGRNDFLHEDVDPLTICTKHVDPAQGIMKVMKGEEPDPELFELVKKNQINTQKGRSKDGYYYAHYRGIIEESMMGKLDEMIIDEGIKYLDEYDKTKPFFMYLTGILPHPAYEIEQEWFDKIDISKIDKPIRLTAAQLEQKASMIKAIRENQKVYGLSDEEFIEIKAIYYAMGSKLDDYIGRLVKELKERDLYDSTTIIFFADHGDFTGDYEIVEKNQNSFEDMLTNVPLIIKPSRTIEYKQRSTDALVELIDVQATIMDIAGVTPDYTQFGHSLVDSLKGKDVHRDTVHSEGGRLKIEGAYATDFDHAVENEYYPRCSEQAKMPQHTKAFMTRDMNYKYVFRLYEHDEFYDMNKDPYETTNLIKDIHKDEKLKEAYEDLRQKALEHLFSTSDIVPHTIDARS